MLQSIDAQGNMQYACTWRPHQDAPACGASNTIHISHEQVRWLHGNEIEVPPCTTCGAIMSVRVPSEQEMTPPIIARDPDGQGYLSPSPGYEHFYNHWHIRTERVDDKDIVREVSPKAWVIAHQELAHQLQAIGKVYVAPPEQPTESMIPLSQVKELVYGILKQHGIDPLEDTGKQHTLNQGNVVTTPGQG
jgi:hypothetical protein